MNIGKKTTGFLLSALVALGQTAIPVHAQEAFSAPVHSDCIGSFPTVKLDTIPNHIQSRKNSGLRFAPGAADTAVNEGEAVLPLLMISVGFRDLPYGADTDLAANYFTGENAISTYYHQQSFGQFTFMPASEWSAYDGYQGSNANTFDQKNDGIVHVELDMDHPDLSFHGVDTAETEEAYDAANKAYNNDVFNVMTAAIEQADQKVDFSQYDADGDGMIQSTELAIGFVLSGYEAAALLGDEDVDLNKYTWSVAINLDAEDIINDVEDFALPVADGIAISTAIFMPEYLYEGDDTLNGTATLAHELGHYLGLPDLYDTQYAYLTDDAEWNSYSVNQLSLMAANAEYDSAEGEEFPASLDAWSKVQLGWLDTQDIYESGIYTVHASDYSNLSDLPDVFMIPTQREYEYYLVENRVERDWDRGLSYCAWGMDVDAETLMNDPVWKQEGIIIWHIDERAYMEYNPYNAINVTTHHPAVMPLYGEKLRDGEMFYGPMGIYAANGRGFYSSDIWEAQYQQDNGDVLKLPVYGADDLADMRDERTFYGGTIKFLDPAGDRMRIEVNLDECEHSIGYEPGFAPTCETMGVREYWYDSLLGEYYLDEECTQLVADPMTELLIESLGHDWDEGVVIKEPTADEPGEMLYTCNNDPEHTMIAEIPPLIIDVEIIDFDGTTTAPDEGYEDEGETTTTKAKTTTTKALEDTTTVIEATTTRAADETIELPEDPTTDPDFTTITLREDTTLPETTTAVNEESATGEDTTTAVNETTAAADTTTAPAEDIDTPPDETAAPSEDIDAFAAAAAKYDLEAQTGIRANGVSVVMGDDGMLTITLSSKYADDMVYVIDPATLKGTNFAGEPVDLNTAMDQESVWPLDGYASYDLSELARRYYTLHTGHYPEYMIMEPPVDGIITMSIAAKGEDIDTVYYIDYKTAMGEDQDGNPVDLNEVDDGYDILPEPTYNHEELIQMAISEYESKTGVEVSSAEIQEIDNNIRKITLYDSKENTLATYIVDAFNGTGVDQDGNPVDLSKFANEDIDVLPEPTYNDEQLLDMAIKDYQIKTGAAAASADIQVIDNNLRNITLYDSEGNVITTYTVDAFNGTGVDQDGNLIDLPQTGNHDATAAAAVSGALCLTFAGWLMLTKSGVLRRRKEDD